MTVAAGIEVGAAIDVGGCKSAGASPGLSRAAAFALGKGSSQGWLGTASASGTGASVSSSEGFRASWQSILSGWGSVPGARSSSTNNGTDAACRIGRVNANGEPDGVEDAPSSISGADADADIVQQLLHPADLGKGFVGSATQRQVSPQNTLSLCTAARAQQIPIPGKGDCVTASAQLTEDSAATNSTSGTSAADNASGTVRSARNEKHDSAAKGAKVEQQVAPEEDGVLALQMNLPGNPAAAQAPVIPEEEQATPKTGITDPVDTVAVELPGNSPAAEPQGTETGSGGAISRGTRVAQTGVTTPAGNRNPASITKSELPDNETSRVTASHGSESEQYVAELQPASPAAAGILPEEPQGRGSGRLGAEGKSRAVTEAYTPAAENRAYQGIEQINSPSVRTTNAGADADKSRLDSGKQSAQQNLARAAQGTVGGEANSSNTHPMTAQPSSVAADASAWVRNPVGAHAALNASSSVATGSTGTQAMTAREAIASLDAAPAVGTPSWLHATSRQAEAGFQDPALGWVGVRADLNGGVVHATVVTSSSEAEQALSGHLAGLSSYLTEQQTPVATLAITTSGGGGLEASVDQSMQQSAGQNAEQRAAAGSQWSANAPASALPLSATVQSSGSGMAVHAGEGRGTYISVMA